MFYSLWFLKLLMKEIKKARRRERDREKEKEKERERERVVGEKQASQEGNLLTEETIVIIYCSLLFLFVDPSKCGQFFHPGVCLCSTKKRNLQFQLSCN